MVWATCSSVRYWWAGQRDRLAGVRLGDGQVALSVAELAPGPRQVHRDRIVDAGVDAARPQMGDQLVARSVMMT